MSDIFREVDEALQREKAAQFWKDYGPTLVLAAIVLVISTGAGTAWRAWQTSQNHKATHTLIAAAEDKDIAAAMEKAASETGGDHKIIALMNAASKYAAKEDYFKASELYLQVATDNSAPSDIRDLATILGQRASAFVSKEGPAVATNRLKYLEPIAKNDKSPFQLQAKLEAAVLYGEELKDYTKALDLLKGFDADNVSPSLKEKATALQHVYEYELSQAPATQAQ